MALLYSSVTDCNALILFSYTAGLDTSASKSKLGWDFLAVVDSGRWKEHTRPDLERSGSDLQSEFFKQLQFIEYEILSGPNKTLCWSVPDGSRDPATGELVHDDLVLSAALAARLDTQPWNITGQPMVILAADPMKELDKGY